MLRFQKNDLINTNNLDEENIARLIAVLSKALDYFQQDRENDLDKEELFLTVYITSIQNLDNHPGLKNIYKALQDNNHFLLAEQAYLFAQPELMEEADCDDLLVYLNRADHMLKKILYSEDFNNEHDYLFRQARQHYEISLRIAKHIRPEWEDLLNKAEDKLKIIKKENIRKINHLKKKIIQLQETIDFETEAEKGIKDCDDLLQVYKSICQPLQKFLLNYNEQREDENIDHHLFASLFNHLQICLTFLDLSETGKLYLQQLHEKCTSAIRNYLSLSENDPIPKKNTLAQALIMQSKIVQNKTLQRQTKNTAPVYHTDLIFGDKTSFVGSQKKEQLESIQFYSDKSTSSHQSHTHLLFNVGIVNEKKLKQKDYLLAALFCYWKKRKKKEEGCKLFGGYDKNEKLNALDDLLTYLDVPYEFNSKHIGPLIDGDLGIILKNWVRSNIKQNAKEENNILPPLLYNKIEEEIQKENTELNKFSYRNYY